MRPFRGKGCRVARRRARDEDSTLKAFFNERSRSFPGLGLHRRPAEMGEHFRVRETHDGWGGRSGSLRNSGVPGGWPDGLPRSRANPGRSRERRQKGDGRCGRGRSAPRFHRRVPSRQGGGIGGGRQEGACRRQMLKQAGEGRGLETFLSFPFHASDPRGGEGVKGPVEPEGPVKAEN